MAVQDPRETLDDLAVRVRDDLARIAHPSQPWLTPRTGPDGRPALDVAIVGGGQSGLAIAFGLMRAQVTNVAVFDRAPRGREGPWLTSARMRTLRSPKEFTGPDLDVPSLTYQSWHEARHGAAHWAALDLIAREDWAAYLLWVRDTVGVPVANEVALTHLAPAAGLSSAEGLIALTTEDASGARELRYARKVVLATGQEGAGGWWMPDFVAHLPARLRAHTADAIDFAGLAGRTVAVLGAGASALDNAATALEHGARAVHLFCRRPEPQTVQPYRAITYAGFLRHLSDLDDAWRWRLMRRVLALREGFPQATWDRCARHPNFHLHAGAPWQDARVEETSRAGEEVVLTTPQGEFRADFLVCGTGVAIDYARRPELAALAHNIAAWGDRYVPPDDEADPRLARFPYLADDYALTERDPGLTPWMRDVHLFAIASTLSFGPSGASINAMTTAVPKLVQGLTRGLFRDDVAEHWARLEAYDVRQAVLRRPEDATGDPS